jgi:hypothetical protein
MFEAVQVRVPAAVPEAPAVDQVTDVTPTMSEASPWNVMVLAVVETMVEAGFVMRSVGGVVLPEPGCGPEGELGLVGEVGVVGEVDVGCACRVTVIVCVAV